jgi:beta-glucosidase
VESDRRVDDLIADLTLDEKAALTAGESWFWMPTIDRLGIGGWRLTDGPQGARGKDFVGSTPTACVPCGSALGATWNPSLLEGVGAVLGDQARTKGARVLLAPTVNLHRSPLGGRTFESYSEDPLLSGVLAAAFVRGVQAQGVAPTVKHFVGNEAEFERNTIDSVIDERTLRELYLLPFEMAVRDGGALGIMTGYNRLNGTWCSEHPELLRILREEWGFEGFVVTDWFAVASTVGSARAGLDLEMPGPGRQYGPKVAEAVRAGALDESDVDAIVRRLFGVLARLGALDDPPPGVEESIDRPEHRAIARRASVESTVLLRNDGVLPFDLASIRSIAVIGQNAARAEIIGGGSANVEPHYRVTPLDAIRRRVGDSITVTYEPGCDLDKDLPPAPIELEEVVFDAGGQEVQRSTRRSAELMYFGAPVPEVGSQWSVRATGTYAATLDGPHQVTLVQAGRARVYVDGVLVIDGVEHPPPPGTAMFGAGSAQVGGTVDLQAGKPVEILIEYANDGAEILAGVIVGLRPQPPPDIVERAVAAAEAADAAVVVVGTNNQWETEGHDRASLALPGDQDDLVRRVCAVNRNTAVVVNTGAPVDMPWAEETPALLQIWFGGQEMADGLADVLAGAAEPSGRLPLTFPRRIEDTPAFGNFPGENGEVRYGEGLLVGYRGYDTRDVPVRFPFGHGFSYTTFEIGEPRVRAEDSAVVEVPVTNTGARPGAEVVQLYVEAIDPPVFRPAKELKAFEKVWLEPGASTTVELRLDDRAFAFWQPDGSAYAAIKARNAEGGFILGPAQAAAVSVAGWRVHPGAYRLHIGRSVQDIVHVVDIDR